MATAQANNKRKLINQMCLIKKTIFLVKERKKISNYLYISRVTRARKNNSKFRFVRYK